MELKPPGKLENLPINTLVPYARNSRTHSPEQIAQIAASIHEFGISQAEFARQLGVDRSHVTRLKQAGRLVLTADGRVDPETSRVRIAATADPNRDDVASRHAAARDTKVSPRDTAPPPAQAPEDKVGNSYQAARAVKEKYLALDAKIDYEKKVGNLIPKEDVDAALKAMGAAVRSAMEIFPDQTAPIVAPILDIEEVHNLLAQACRDVLAGIEHSLARYQAELPGAAQ